MRQVFHKGVKRAQVIFKSVKRQLFFSCDTRAQVYQGSPCPKVLKCTQYISVAVRGEIFRELSTIMAGVGVEIGEGGGGGRGKKPGVCPGGM